MRASAPLRPLTLAAAVASLGWSLIAGCFSDNTEYRTHVASIVVHQVLFPDSVPVGQADSLVVRAHAGYPGCLPAQVSFHRSGDSLVVSGTYSCRYPVLSRADPVGIRVTTPPVSAIETRVVLALPDLEAGTYLVVAEPYPLIDTLVIVPQGPVTRHERLAGVGYVYEHTVAGCASLPIVYENDPVERQLRRVYLLENALAPFSSMFVKINATVVGPASCDSSFAGVLHLRHLELRN